MKHVEYEERVMISKSNYQKIVEDIKSTYINYRSLEIENTYLDNDDFFIYKSKKMLRVRTINNKDKELTLKIKNKDGSCIEINETLENHPLIDKELNNQFSKYKPIASLKTNRIEVQIDDYLLVIDENKYSDITDYDIEIEAESQQKALQILLKYCDLYHLEYNPKYKSKSHRAISKVIKKDEEC